MGNMLTSEQLLEDTSIAVRAMKAVFHRGTGVTRRVRDIAAEVIVKNQFGDEGQLVTRKVFIDKAGLVYKRQQLANEMYVYHVKATLPHGDDGSRLLPNMMYMEYTSTMQQFESQLKLMDASIISTYAQLVQDDCRYRNAALMGQGKVGNVNPAEYPTVQQISAYLYIDWRLEPISTVNDFRYAVDDHIKAKVTESLVRATQEAKADMVARMAAPMQRFIEALSVPDKVFRDSLVANVNDVSQEIRKLNFDEDPNIAALAVELERVIKPYVFNPDVLREVPEVRTGARDKMKELMQKLEGYGMGGK